MFLEIEQVKAWNTISRTTLVIKHREHKKKKVRKFVYKIKRSKKCLIIVQSDKEKKLTEG